MGNPAFQKNYVPEILPQAVMSMGINGNNFPVMPPGTLQAAMQKRREGRLSKFNEEIATEIVERLEDGQTLVKISESVGIQRSAIWTWMQLSPEFKTMIAAAREFQAHSMADDAQQIVDDLTVDPDNPKASMAEARKADLRSKYRCELAKAYNFRQYGDKRQVETNITIETVEQRVARLTGAANVIEIASEDYEVL